MKKASDKAILRLKYIKEQVENLDTPKVCKDILEGIVNGNDYSPVLFDAFLRWRTLTQSLEYGMSNFSKIPKLLLFLPNISRGGLMGNYNLSFWASLYLDM